MEGYSSFSKGRGILKRRSYLFSSLRVHLRLGRSVQTLSEAETETETAAGHRRLPAATPPPFSSSLPSRRLERPRWAAAPALAMAACWPPPAATWPPKSPWLGRSLAAKPGQILPGQPVPARGGRVGRAPLGAAVGVARLTPRRRFVARFEGPRSFLDRCTLESADCCCCCCKPARGELRCSWPRAGCLRRPVDPPL